MFVQTARKKSKTRVKNNPHSDTLKWEALKKNDDIEIVIKKTCGLAQAAVCSAHSSWPERGRDGAAGPLLIGHRALRCSHVDED